MADARTDGYDPPRIEDRASIVDPLIGNIVSGNIDAPPKV